MPGERDDRLSRWLKGRGYQLDQRWIAQGDRLPDPEEGHVAAVIYGGSQMVGQADELDYLRDELAWVEQWLGTERPLLGLCLGAQVIAKVLGAEVGPHPEGMLEVGFYPLEPTEAGRELFPEPMVVYHWHRQGFALPPGATLLARGQTFPNQAFRYGAAVGLQFHPEITSEIQQAWLSSPGSAQTLEQPNAQPRAEQLEQADRHLPALGSWLERFAARWLATPGPAHAQAE